MKLEYIGHDSFSIEARDGTRIVCDPYRPGSVPDGLAPFPSGLRADAVTVSHIHPDHNYPEGVALSPLLISEPGDYRVGSLKVKALDGREGSPTGHSDLRNLVFVIESEGAKVVHLGDSGLIEDPEALAAISDADLVIVNIDGYVILPDLIMPFMARIRARSVVPAHYSLSAEDRMGDAPTVEEFLSALGSDTAVSREGSTMEVHPGMARRVVAMTPSNLK